MEKGSLVQRVVLAVFVLVLGVSVAALPVWAQEAKPAPEKLDVGKMTCKELMAGDDQNREIGIAFMHGFFAGKKGSAVIDIKAITEQTERVKDYCLSNPTNTLMDAFTKTAK